jgi:hypothetical protein
MKLLATAVALAASLAVLHAGPELFYSKYFKGSTPEYVAITVERDGAVTYQEAKEDDDPVKFQLERATADQMFDLAGKLDHFQHPLESGLKIANLGQKTFRFTDGDEHHEEQFNYSQDPDAQALLDRFESITESERHYEDLDRTVHFDKLGVNEVLLGMQVSLDHNRLVGLDQFLPLLDRVAKNESYLHIDRERAAAIAETIRNPRAAQKPQAGATQ